MSSQPEYWLRGPIDGVPALLQPVAHALLQSLDEVEAAVRDFPDALLWQKPAETASVGFHLLHLPGMIDRLFTYARGEALTPEQLERLSAEKLPAEGATAKTLLSAYRRQVERSLEQLRGTPEDSLIEPRFVGRKRLPSTVLGLLFHAAEHAQRHTGQLLVTARVVRAGDVA